MDAVIVLSRNWKRLPRGYESQFGMRQLRIDSKMNAVATAEMLKKGMFEYAIICGGKTAGNQYQSESVAMKNYINHTYGNEFERRILLDELSFDTPDNAEKARDVLKGYKFDNLSLLTVKAHLPRAVRIFRHYGMEVRGLSSEDILAEKSEHHARFVRSYKGSCFNCFEHLKEMAILRPLNYVDPLGIIPRVITARLPTRKH